MMDGGDDDMALRVDRLIAGFTVDAFLDGITLGLPTRRPVFLVGMPHTGVSEVERMLARHSRVAAPGESAACTALVGALAGLPLVELPKQAAQVAAHARRYLSSLDSAADGAERVIDRAPDILFHLGLLALCFPQSRVVICRRNVLDWVASCCREELAAGVVGDLVACGRRWQEMDRLIGHWRRVLPVPLLELHYERLRADGAAQSRRLIDFLELDWEDACAPAGERPPDSTPVGLWLDHRSRLRPLFDALRDAPALRAAVTGSPVSQ